MAFTALTESSAHLYHTAPKAVIKFTAPWCAPCKAFQPVLEQLAQENPDIQFFEVNIDEAPKLSAQFQIRSVPTTVGFKAGQLQWQLMGLVPAKKVQEHLSKL